MTNTSVSSLWSIFFLKSAAPCAPGQMTHISTVFSFAYKGFASSRHLHPSWKVPISHSSIRWCPLVPHSGLQIMKTDRLGMYALPWCEAGWVGTHHDIPSSGFAHYCACSLLFSPLRHIILRLYVLIHHWYSGSPQHCSNAFLPTHSARSRHSFICMQAWAHQARSSTKIGMERIYSGVIYCLYRYRRSVRTNPDYY